MTQKSPAYRWYPKDILGSLRVASMTAAEECWYRRALDFAWLNNGLPSDPVKLSRIIGKKCTAAGARLVLEMFEPSTNDPGVFVNERQEVERQKQKEWSEKSSQGGKKSKPPNKQTGSKQEPPLEPNRKQKGTLQFAIAEESSTEDSKRGQPQAATSPKKPKSSDPRQDHPAIKAFLATTGKWPLKDLWDALIDAIGDKPDEVLLKRCWVAWRGKGFSPTNYAWVLEWYAAGGPNTNANGKNRTPGKSNIDTLQQSSDYFSQKYGTGDDAR